MKSDQRYMKPGRSHGSTWFFVLSIPPDLRGHPRFLTSRGKPSTKITESLATTDLHKAQEARNHRLAYWTRQFRMMQEGPSEEDIQEEAVEIFRATLKVEAARPADWGWRPPVDYLRRLDNEIGVHVYKEMRDFLGRTGAVLEPGTEPYRKIGEAFLKAKVAAGGFGAMLPLPDGRWVRADEQHLPPLPQIEPPEVTEPKPVTAPPPKAKGAETFADAAAFYLSSELRDGVKDATVAEYRRKIAAFEHKDKPLRLITRGQAADFLDGLKVSKRTRNLYAALFSAVYRSAIRRERASANPFADQRLNGVAKVHYEPFTDQEIATLFDAKPEIAPAAHTTATALPWVVRIGAFTGMRREEIAALMADDIKRDGDVWYSNIRDGKTANATRTVP